MTTRRAFAYAVDSIIRQSRSTRQRNYFGAVQHKSVVAFLRIQKPVRVYGDTGCFSTPKSRTYLAY